MGSALGLSVYDYHVRIPAGMQVTKQDMSKGEAIPVANKHT
jgi:phosphatidylserine decarboxylase